MNSPTVARRRGAQHIRHGLKLLACATETTTRGQSPTIPRRRDPSILAWTSEEENMKVRYGSNG